MKTGIVIGQASPISKRAMKSFNKDFKQVEKHAKSLVSASKTAVDVPDSTKNKIQVDSKTYIDLRGERQLPHAKELAEAENKGVKIEPIVDTSAFRKTNGSVIEKLKALGIDVKSYNK